MRLKHRPSGQYIAPGQAVDLSHLSFDEIELLKARGAIMEGAVPQAQVTIETPAEETQPKTARKSAAQEG